MRSIPARPHDRVAIDLASLSLDEAELRDLPWVRSGVAGVRRVGASVELEIGPYAGELWLDPDTRIDVVELLPGTVATCLRISSTGRRIGAQAISGRGVLPPTVAVASVFAETLQRALLAGVHKEYVDRRVTTNRPRGKIDIAATIRGPWAKGHVDQVATRRRDLADDNDLNRALLAACVEAEWRLAGRWQDLARIRSAAMALRGAALDRAAYVPSDEDAPLRFSPPLSLARDLLHGVATATGGQHDRGHHSAWVNVERVFEEAVRTVFSRIFDGQVTRGEAEGVPLFQALPTDPLPMRKTANPDVVLRRDGRVVGVLDAKYRRSGENPSDDEIYQLIAHAGAFEAKKAALITPALHGPPATRRLGRTADGCAIDVISVDSSSEYRMQASVTAWVRAIEGSAR